MSTLDFSTLDAPHSHVWAVTRRAALRGGLALGAAVPLLLLGRRAAAAPQRAPNATCSTTANVPIEGPYYLGDPEPRTRTGSGVTIRGVVRAAQTCAPLAGASIIRWHSNRTGIYEDYYRALMTTGADGSYQMETIVPGIYAGLSRHVHFYVTAPGYRPRITQIQWQNTALPPADNEFDFVLDPVAVSP